MQLLGGGVLYAAQSQQLIFERNQFYQSASLTTEHGLPANGINDIIQDQQGYIWIATFNGLVRYDGLSYKEYNVSNVEGLNSNRFHVVIQDRKGNIWAGVQDNTLLMIAGNTSSVYTIRIDGADVRAEVTALSEGPDGAIWIGAHSGLFRFSDGLFTRIDAIPRQTIKHITHSDTHTYIVQQENIYRAKHDGSEVSLSMSLSGGTLIAPGNSTAEMAVESSSFFVSIAADEDFYWLLTNKDLFKVQSARTQIQHKISGAALGFNNLLGISLQDGRMFMYGSHGLFELIFPVGERVDQRVRIRSFSDQFIRNMVIDYEGTFWLATRAGGVLRFVPTPINIDSGLASLNQTAITSITGSRDGAVWFGTNCDGLYRYFENELKQFRYEYGFANSCIWSVYEQSDGTIWAGTWSDGVYFRPPDARMFQKFEDWEHSDDSIVLAIFEDSAGVIWFGTYSQGLVRWDGETAEIIRDMSGNKIAVVRDLFEDEHNKLWIATDRGVGFVQDGRFLSKPELDILSTNAFRTIARDANGRFLFGSNGGGMVVYSPGQVPLAVTAESGLLDESISQLTTDHRGNIWLGGNRGLFMIDSLHAERFFSGESTDLPITPFGVAEGMPNRETTGGFSPSLHLSESGILYIPTVQGLAEIHTEQMNLNRKPPNTLIEEIIIDGVSFLPDEVDDIPHNVQQLVFRFTALSFMNPEYVRFQYMVKGFHTEWQAAGRQREAVFTSLPPGNFTFRVRATNNAGIQNDQDVGLSFKITPPFWQTLWFYGLLIVISAGGGLAFTRYQIKAGIRREYNLQQTVKEQTAAITREKKPR
ncbi:ligand-binding sensor domain-containing protein [Cyclonatronum proteinivorum]|uniref:Ligand-binding sensor domain-containing protein n=1 Tax=Cyclonatronum proteinivorum TaxID=1457365 RepID=A0A345UL14_9BACT|nr:two-component regulator propeller domain-containing protein [Cyclonatronum proteinivorum]AXJ01166.1 ligand-binding sensor domain-containing protein [Cyclonatronum proteinivorum]